MGSLTATFAWAEEVAATHRDAGVSTPVTITPYATEVAETYVDCHATESARRVLVNGVYENRVIKTVDIPRRSGATKPVKGSFCLVSGESAGFEIAAVLEDDGLWTVESAP